MAGRLSRYSAVSSATGKSARIVSGQVPVERNPAAVADPVTQLASGNVFRQMQRRGLSETLPKL